MNVPKLILLEKALKFNTKKIGGLIMRAKISEEKLQEIIENHGKWLRDEPEGQRADLRNIDLSNSKLANINLRGAYLENVDLNNSLAFS